MSVSGREFPAHREQAVNARPTPVTAAIFRMIVCPTARRRLFDFRPIEPAERARLASAITGWRPRPSADRMDRTLLAPASGGTRGSTRVHHLRPVIRALCKPAERHVLDPDPGPSSPP